MSKTLSQIVTDLFAKPAEGKELSSQIKRLGSEIRSVVEGEETLYGKFRRLLDSLKDVIPDEQQRYHAAFQALSTTAKLGRQDILKAFNDQLEELKIVEKSIMPSLPAWRDEVKTMEARLRDVQGDLAGMRERLSQLESEEKTLLATKAAREKDLNQAEKSIRDVFANIGAEITSYRKKMEEAGAANLTPPGGHPVPQKAPGKPAAAVAKKESPAQKAEVEAPSAPVDTKWQKKCPMCGGRFNLLELENIWQCYTCAYEEPVTNEAKDK